MYTSTNGRNIPCVCHLRSLAATTETERGRRRGRLNKSKITGINTAKPPWGSFTFHCNLVLSSVGVSEDLHVDGHLSDGIVHPRA